jgi:hypothetical protein
MATSLEHHISRRVSSIGDLWAYLRIAPRRPSRYDKQNEWRLIIPPEHGYFHGLESTTTSIALATDGVHHICERSDGAVIEGHVLNWVKMSSIKPPTVCKAKKVKQDKDNERSDKTSNDRAIAVAKLVSLLTD